MKLRQPERGFRYNSDSLALYDFVLSARPSGRLLDVGCGCGVVGLLLLRDLDVELVGVDKQEAMAELARANARANDLQASFHGLDVLEMGGEKFDAVVSNPPYYDGSGTRCADPALQTARYDEHLPLDRLLWKTGSLLKTGGTLFFCYRADAVGMIMASLEDWKFAPVRLRFVHPREGADASLLLVQAKKGKRVKTRVEAPLYLDSEEMAAVSRRSATETVA